MTPLSQLTRRNYLIAAHDALATAVALLASFYLRFDGGEGFYARLPLLLRILPFFVVFSVVICYVFNLTTTKWRFISLPDALNILRVATVLTLALLVLDYAFIFGAPNGKAPVLFGRITIVLYWFLQVFALSALRFGYRYFRYSRVRRHARTEGASSTLLIGRAADAEVLLRGIESGAVKQIWPVGVLSPSAADRGQSIRNVPVLGGIDDVEDVIRDFAGRGQADFAGGHDAVGVRARGASRSGPDAGQAARPDRQPPAVARKRRRAAADQCCRRGPAAAAEREDRLCAARSAGEGQGGHRHRRRRLDRFGDLRPRRDLRRRAAAGDREFRAGALRGDGGAGGARPPAPSIEGRIADIRDRDRIMHLMGEFKPDIVFHAAALKHVPILERDWSEGVKTNIFGSVNVADAALAAGAEAMVMISTDKAIEPVSMLGLTKRFAEMYCQALDHDLMTQSDGKPRMRLISVRFGNVLASNGSVVPKFKAQIEAGGPVTVTHPDMVRYFMTIREACDLVLTAATHALTPARPDVSVYVLNMGQPVKIVELAERMIRLSGLEPGHRYRDRVHRHAAGRAAERNPVRQRGAAGGDRRRRHHGGQAERAADADVAQMARGARGGDRAG